MPNTPRNLPAAVAPIEPIGVIFQTPLSDRVARLTEASKVAEAAYQQASQARLAETRDEALRLHAHLAGIEEVLLSAGF